MPDPHPQNKHASFPAVSSNVRPPSKLLIIRPTSAEEKVVEPTTVDAWESVAPEEKIVANRSLLQRMLKEANCCAKPSPRAAAANPKQRPRIINVTSSKGSKKGTKSSISDDQNDHIPDIEPVPIEVKNNVPKTYCPGPPKIVTNAAAAPINTSSKGKSKGKQKGTKKSSCGDEAPQTILNINVNSTKGPSARVVQKGWTQGSEINNAPITLRPSNRADVEVIKNRFLAAAGPPSATPTSLTSAGAPKLHAPGARAAKLAMGMKPNLSSDSLTNTNSQDLEGGPATVSNSLSPDGNHPSCYSYNNNYSPDYAPSFANGLNDSGAQNGNNNMIRHVPQYHSKDSYSYKYQKQQNPNNYSGVSQAHDVPNSSKIGDKGNSGVSSNSSLILFKGKENHFASSNTTTTTRYNRNSRSPLVVNELTSLQPVTSSAEEYAKHIKEMLRREAGLVTEVPTQRRPMESPESDLPNNDYGASPFQAVVTESEHHPDFPQELRTLDDAVDDYGYQQQLFFYGSEGGKYEKNSEHATSEKDMVESKQIPVPNHLRAGSRPTSNHRLNPMAKAALAAGKPEVRRAGEVKYKEGCSQVEEISPALKELYNIQNINKSGQTRDQDTEVSSDSSTPSKQEDNAEEELKEAGRKRLRQLSEVGAFRKGELGATLYGGGRNRSLPCVTKAAARVSVKPVDLEGLIKGNNEPSMLKSTVELTEGLLQKKKNLQLGAKVQKPPETCATFGKPQPKNVMILNFGETIIINIQYYSRFGICDAYYYFN